MSRRITAVLVTAALVACSADLGELGVGSDRDYVPYQPSGGSSSGASTSSGVITTNYRPYCIVTESTMDLGDPSISFKPTSCSIPPRQADGEPQVIIFRQDPDMFPEPSSSGSSVVIQVPLLVFVLPGVSEAPASQTFTFTPWPAQLSLELTQSGSTGPLVGASPTGPSFCFDPMGVWALQAGMTLGCESRAARDTSKALLGASGTTSLASTTMQQPVVKTQTLKQLVQPDGSTLLISTFEFEAVYNNQSTAALSSGHAKGKIKVRAGTYPTTRDPSCKAEVPVVPTGAACIASFDDCSKSGGDAFCDARCRGKICQGANCCTPGGAYCANDADCCKGLACVNSSCADRPSVEAEAVAPVCRPSSGSSSSGGLGGGSSANDPCGAAGNWLYTCPADAITSGNCAGLQPFSSFFEVSDSIASRGGTWRETGSGVAVDLTLNTKTCQVTGTLPGVCEGLELAFDLHAGTGTIPAYCSGNCNTRVTCKLEHNN